MCKLSFAVMGFNQDWVDKSSTKMKKLILDNNKMIYDTNKKISKSEGKVVGSRRNFSLRFKLDVLDAYRNDPECKGNQRATARKHKIHRRQIQKWLQMEANLRSQMKPAPSETALNLSSSRQLDVEKPCYTRCLTASFTETISESIDNLSQDESDIEINVDKYSSEEEEFNDDRSLSPYDQTDQALDFTCATLYKRGFFTDELKRSVLEAYYNDKTCIGDKRATAHKFGIKSRYVHKLVLENEQLSKKQSLHLSYKRETPPPSPQMQFFNNFTTSPTNVSTPTPPTSNLLPVDTPTTCCSMCKLYCSSTTPQMCYFPPLPSSAYHPQTTSMSTYNPPTHNTLPYTQTEESLKYWIKCDSQHSLCEYSLPFKSIQFKQVRI